MGEEQWMQPCVNCGNPKPSDWECSCQHPPATKGVKTMDTYKIEIHYTERANSVEEAFASFKDRLLGEETMVCIEHIQSGEKYFLRIETGEVLSMKC
jgi:hypothetical protein